MFLTFRNSWDVLGIVVLMLNMIVLPLNIAFFHSAGIDFWIVFHSISDMFFLVDIVLNFRTGYKEDTTGYCFNFILEPKMIARR